MTLTTPRVLAETEDWTCDVTFDDDGNVAVNLTIRGTMNGDSALALAHSIVEMVTGEDPT